MNLDLRVACAFGVIAAALLGSGCNKVDESRKIDGPNNGATYVIETSYGLGAATSDYTVLSAVSRGDKEGKKVLVLSGENLVIQKLTWTDANNVYICLKGGITDRYANQVSIGPIEKLVKIRNHLVEDC
jgi:hypothetical protein